MSAQSVLGLKWLDRDGDGRRDANEPGLAGVTIYSDLNNNQRPGAGKPRTTSQQDNRLTPVDETGLYRLDELARGTHAIHEVIPVGFAQTFPQGGTHQITLEPGTVADGIDFGNQLTGLPVTILRVEQVEDMLEVEIFANAGFRYVEETSTDLLTWIETGRIVEGNDSSEVCQFPIDSEPRFFVRYRTE